MFAFSVGGATAAGLIGGKQIRNHSIGLIDIKRTAQKALHGQRGARGLVGPAGPDRAAEGLAGPAGVPGPAQPSTTAYARVTRSGTVMADFSRNIKQVNVVRTAAGQYCFRGSVDLDQDRRWRARPSGSAIGATVNPPTDELQLRRLDVCAGRQARGQRFLRPVRLRRGTSEARTRGSDGAPLRVSGR